MRRALILTTLAGAALTLAACGSNGTQPTASPEPPAPATVSPTATPGSTVAVKAATSPLGQILVDPEGRTLYAFTNDTNAQSTCTGACAEAWPPVVVDESWNVAPGLDAGVFSTTTRPEGTLQLIAGRFPLYYFSGDAKPGDVNGQGSGNVWFVVDGAANPVHEASAAPTTVAPAAPTTPAPAPTTEAPAAAAVTVQAAGSPLGTILVGPDGRTMYGFTQDANGVSTCSGGCAKAWPPVLVTGAIIPAGTLDAALFTTIDRPDGTKQLKAGKWPLYYFSGDSGPGERNGQGSGGSWFVVGQDAKLVKAAG